MARPRHRFVWEEQASLSADYLQTNWNAFVGYAGPVQPDGYDVADVSAVELMHDAGRDLLTLFYSGHDGDRQRPVLRRVTMNLERLPCHFGGFRMAFRAPCCGRRVRRLALLPSGVVCGRCGSLTYRSRRRSGVQRIIDRADRLAGRLQCECWYASPKARPKGMRRNVFDRLSDMHAEEVRRANAIIQPRLIRAARRGEAAYWSAMLRAGL